MDGAYMWSKQLMIIGQTNYSISSINFLNPEEKVAITLESDNYYPSPLIAILYTANGTLCKILTYDQSFTKVNSHGILVTSKNVMYRGG